MSVKMEIKIKMKLIKKIKMPSMACHGYMKGEKDNMTKLPSIMMMKMIVL